MIWSATFKISPIAIAVLTTRSASVCSANVTPFDWRAT
jgi:hypothetical protein